MTDRDNKKQENLLKLTWQGDLHFLKRHFSSSKQPKIGIKAGPVTVVKDVRTPANPRHPTCYGESEHATQ